MMKDLWMLKEYCGGPSIIQGIRESVAEYLKRKEIEIGTSIEDAAQTIEKEKHERESN